MSEEFANARLITHGGQEPAATPAASGPDPDRRGPVSVRMRVGTYWQARQALSDVGRAEGLETIGELVERAIERELERLSELYNDGQPFPEREKPLPTRRLP